MEVKPGYKQTEVGVIPEEWEVEPLGHLIKLRAGYSFRSENVSDIGMPIIRISDIQDGIVNTDSGVCHPPFKIGDDFVVKNGDFLVAMSGATTGKVGVFHSPKADSRPGCPNHFFNTVSRVSEAFPCASMSSMIWRIVSGKAILMAGSYRYRFRTTRDPAQQIDQPTEKPSPSPAAWPR